MSGLVLTTLLFSAAAVSAGIIRLKDGEELNGKILRRTATEVIVQFEFGTMSFSPDEIVEVEAEPLPEKEVPAAPPERLVEQPSNPTVGQAAVPSAAPTMITPVSTPGTPDSIEQPAATELPEAMKAVAFIGSMFPNGSVGVGSGTLINSKGVMVTNYHVVGQATGVGVMLPRFGSNKGKQSRPYEARVLKVDPCYDLALVRIPVKTPAYLRFADEEEEEAITAGAEVRAIGNPQGLAISVSRGIISAVRTLKDFGMGLVDDFSVPECAHLSGRTLESMAFIQTDAAINPGNSGGPLLNAKNEIVGINTFIYSESGGSVGLNFALHVKHVKRFVGSYAKE